MVFSGVCYRIKWRAENIKRSQNTSKCELVLAILVILPFLSLSVVLSLYPSGLTADSCLSGFYPHLPV